MKKCILMLFFALILNARENPFIPSVKEHESVGVNNVEQIEQFKNQEVSLESDARVLKYLTIGYQSLDGSIKEKKVLIDKSIDWHNNLILNVQEDPNTASFSNIEPNVDEEELNEPTEDEKILNVEKPQEKIEPNIEPKMPEKEIKRLRAHFKIRPNFAFFTDKNQLEIHTKDALIRNFMVINPHRIVFDFKRNSSFYTKNIIINQPPFKNLTLGSHDDFYRATFLLDGPYIKSVKKLQDKIIVDLK